MGLLDFFFRPLPFDKFAQRFMREMKKAGVSETLTFDREQDRIVRGKVSESRSIFLGNFYQEYLSLPATKRGRHLIARARLFAIEQNEHPDDFAEARLHLRPKLWVRSMLEKTRLQIEIDGGDPDKFDVPDYEVGSHLVASLVYDLPETMKSIQNSDLRDWGVTYYEALEIARENLGQAPFVVARIGEGCYATSTGDSYDSCRLLLPSFVEKCQVKGDLIAMVASRDSLLIAGSDDDASLSIMLALTKKACEEPRPMVPIPVCLDGDAWVDWMPEGSHPLSADFRELAMRFWFQEYGEQKELLERLNEKNENPVFVASYSAVEKDDGSFYSYSVWAKDVETWLPQTEWVMFVRGEEDVPAVARWEKVEQVVGHLMERTEHYPARFHVTRFPSDKELSALGKAEP